MKLPITSLILALRGNSYASNDSKDTTFNFYGVNSKIDKDQSSSNGLGFMYDSEEIKIKLESTSDFTKFGGVLKINPLNTLSNIYFKLGTNYLNKKCLL